MYVKELRLHHFRNYDRQEISFPRGLIIIQGRNAQGKTNLLEAIAFLATGRSHRTARDQELIMHGQDEMSVRATVVRGPLEQGLELRYSAAGKTGLVNGQPERRLASLVGRVAAVFFSPDDLVLVKGPPASRRRFLDVELSQLFPAYLYHLQRYARILHQRNALLRKIAAGEADLQLLSLWDTQLAAEAGEIICRRSVAVRQLAQLARTVHAELTEQSEMLSVSYSCSIIEEDAEDKAEQISERLLAQITRQRRDDIRRGTTQTGPHRDDLILHINGQEARTFGSQGQQRTAVLALKIAEMQFMSRQLQDSPVLLLDDVISELDPQRRRQLLSLVDQETQTLLTCTDLSDLTLPTGMRTAHFLVRDGTVRAE